MLRYLIIKELIFLGVLTLLGLGLAAQLRRWRVPAMARLALAPSFGFAAAMCLLVTANFFVPLRWALWWLLVPAIVGSCLWAWRTERRDGGLRLDRGRAWRDGGVLALVLIVPLLVVNGPQDARYSPGPVAFGIFDSQMYVNYIQGFQNHTNNEPFREVLFPYPSHEYDDVAWGEPWNLTLRAGWGFKWQHSGASTVPAALGATFGWPPWLMQAPWSLTLLLVAALGTAGLVRAMVPARWPALLAGLAAAGPTLFQLWGDGSQGLLSGVALVPAFLVTAWLVVREQSKLAAVLCGIMLAGFHTSYPEIFPQAVGTLALLASIPIVGHLWRRRRLARKEVLRVAGLGALTGATTLLASPRSGIWLIEYVRRQIVDPEAFISITPSNLYEMHGGKLAGWLTQTVEFYDIAFADPTGLRFALVGVVLPLALLLGAAVAFRRIPFSRALLAFAFVACLQAYLSATRLDCSYCVQRTLLTLAPAVAAAVWVGVYAVRSLGGHWRDVGTGLGVLAALATAATMLTVKDRITTGAVMASKDMLPVLDKAQGLDGTLQIEGFESIPYESWTEQSFWYQALTQTTDQRLSTVAAYNDYEGFLYTRTRPEVDPAYTPDYEYVLSRYGSLDLGRVVLYRHGPVVLARRTRPFDVTGARGVAMDPARRDPSGTAWVQKPGNTASTFQKAGPLTFWIAAQSTEPAYLTMILAGPPELRLNGSSPLQRRMKDKRLWACIPVSGTGAQRIATASVTPEPPEMGPSTGGEFDPVPAVARQTRLDYVRASVTPCREALRAVAAGEQATG